MTTVVGSVAITALFIEDLHKQFVKDDNPLHVWQAYQWSRRPPRPLPDWVADYFDHCAEALLGGLPPSHALRLATKGGHSKFRQFADDSRDIGIFSYLDFCMSLTRDDLPDDYDDPDGLFGPLLRGETKLDRLCDDVAAETQRPRNGFDSKPLSAKTLRDLYFRLKPKS